MAIFHDMIDTFMEVFMDYFSVFGSSFKDCLSNLDLMLARCENTNLVLNWEKWHFMVKEGIVLGHKVSSVIPPNQGWRKRPGVEDFMYSIITTSIIVLKVNTTIINIIEKVTS